MICFSNLSLSAGCSVLQSKFSSIVIKVICFICLDKFNDRSHRPKKVEMSEEKARNCSDHDPRKVILRGNNPPGNYEAYVMLYT